jgi:hypothetical protein
MSFSAFNSFIQKLTFQHYKSQLKNLSFIFVFTFSVFPLEKLARKQKFICASAFELLKKLVE